MKKKEFDNVFINARDVSNKSASKGNARNSLWWERMPMTYKNWEGVNRELETLADFNHAEEILLSNSPYLREHYDFSIFNDKKVLDLGCGSGVLSVILAKNGADVTAADLTENATKMTQHNGVLQQLNIKVIRTDAENLAFANKSFDYVLSWGVLHHTENTERAFNEVSRTLKDDGTGLVMVYHKSSIFYYLKGLIWLFLKGKIFKGYNLRTVIDFYVDGNVNACACRGVDRSLVIGDLKKTSLNKILSSENKVYRNIIDRHQKNDYPETCKDCNVYRSVYRKPRGWPFMSIASFFKKHEERAQK